MYVQRDAKGQICAAYSEAQFRTQESVPNDNPGLVAYLTRSVLSRALFTNVGLSVDDIALLATRTGKYVERGSDEEVISATAEPQRDFQELLPNNAAELVAFLQQEPPEPEPAGFRYQFAPNGWRILGLGDSSLLAQGLPNREACVTFMRERASRLKQVTTAFRAK